MVASARQKGGQRTQPRERGGFSVASKWLFIQTIQHPPLIHIKSYVVLVSYIFNVSNQESFPFLSKTKLLKTKNKKHIFFLTAQKELTGFDHNFLTFETSYERTDEYDGRISQVVKDV